MHLAANVPKGPVGRYTHPLNMEVTENENLCVMIPSNRKQDLAESDQITRTENVKTWILDNFDWPFLFSPWHILLLWLKMFIWFSLKRETEIFYWFSPSYKSQFLQTLIPVWCTLWTFKERWNTKKGVKFTQWINCSMQANIHRKPLAIFTIFMNNVGQSHTYDWYYKTLDCESAASFPALLMQNTESSLCGEGCVCVKRVSMNLKKDNLYQTHQSHLLRIWSTRCSLHWITRLCVCRRERQHRSRGGVGDGEILGRKGGGKKKISANTQSLLV